MDRRRAVGIGAAVAVGGLTMLLLTPGVAVGRHSAGEPHEPPSEKFFICHDGKTLRITYEELLEHAGHLDDTTGKCPK
jgi:hypothetical protein